jgi:hypothetical protein
MRSHTSEQLKSTTTALKRSERRALELKLQLETAESALAALQTQVDA